MAQKTLLPSQEVAILGGISPNAYSASTQTSGWVSLANFQAIMAILDIGTMGAGSSYDAKIEQAQDDTGTGAKDLEGLAITQLTQAGVDASGSKAVLELYGEDLDLENAFTHVRVSVTTAGGAIDHSAVVLGMKGRYGPASDYDVDSVVEIVSV